MTITLCNSHPFTFYLPFHTSLRADQCPIQSHVPSTCTLGLDPCARHSLFGRTDPYYIDNFYSSCGLKRLAATLASPFSVIVLSSQYLFQRGPIWVWVTLIISPVSVGSRNSSVGRALDWRSKGPWFDPGFRQKTPATANYIFFKLFQFSFYLFMWFPNKVTIFPLQPNVID